MEQSLNNLTFKITATFKRQNYTLEKTIKYDNDMDTFLTERDQHRDDLMVTLLSHFATFSIVENSPENIHVVVDTTDDNSQQIIPVLQEKIFGIPVAEEKPAFAANVIFQIKRTESHSALLDDLLSTAKRQNNRYITVFLSQQDNHGCRSAAILYLNSPIKLNMNEATAKVLKLKSVENTLYISQKENELPISITTFELNDTDISMEVLGFIATLQKQLEQAQPKSLEQGQKETDNPNLVSDLLMKEGVLYSFASNDPHGLKVFEHSALHHRLPFCLFHSVMDGKIYAIIHNRIEQYITNHIAWLKYHGHIVVTSYVNDISGTKVCGYGIVEDNVRYKVSESILSLMVNGLI